MGELRDRMQQDLILHGMAPRTRESYLAAVRGLATYYHQRPDTLSEVQVQTYVRYLIEERRLAPSSVRVAVMGLRFFYTQTLQRPWTNLPLPKRTKTLPEVLRGYPGTAYRFRRPLFGNGIPGGVPDLADGALTGCYADGSARHWIRACAHNLCCGGGRAIGHNLRTVPHYLFGVVNLAMALCVDV